MKEKRLNKIANTRIEYFTNYELLFNFLFLIVYSVYYTFYALVIIIKRFGRRRKNEEKTKY